MSKTAPAPTQTYISDTELARRYGLNRATLWRWVQTGRFPKPVQLSPGCSRWRADEVENFEAARAAARAADHTSAA